MHFNQILPYILVSATAAVAELIPVGPIATVYAHANFEGRHFSVGTVGQCVQLPNDIVGHVGSVRLQQFPQPFYVACALYSNDYCQDPAASVIYYATALFNNSQLPDTRARSIACKLNQNSP
ncbi:uncharacterized protein TrAtP1_003553 [Trichoderma atroviride]|uniref:uncharacterized protein n=1 Tax=Hypocrea atroviridis TaxID=63577 RepID=UPI003334A2B1|nr:hypothetical protein TrAtP1_003553 [Trichoderma atroviride]